MRNYKGRSSRKLVGNKMGFKIYFDDRAKVYPYIAITSDNSPVAIGGTTLKDAMDQITDYFKNSTANPITIKEAIKLIEDEKWKAYSEMNKAKPSKKEALKRKYYDWQSAEEVANELYHSDAPDAFERIMALKLKLKLDRNPIVKKRIDNLPVMSSVHRKPTIQDKQRWARIEKKCDIYKFSQAEMEKIFNETGMVV